MKSKTARLPDELGTDIEKIASANRTSESKIIELACEMLVEQVKKTDRLPLPPVELSK